MLKSDKLKILNNILLYLEGGFSIEKALQRSNQSIHQDIQRGLSLSDSLRKLGFPDFVVQNIKMGEETGKLKDVIRNLVEIIESSIDFQKSLRLSLLTPFVSFSFAILILFFVVSFVIPEIAATMADMGISISKSVEFISAIGLYLKKNIYSSLFFTISVIGFFGYILFSYRLPIFREFTISFILKSISLCLRSGIELQRALSIVSETSNIKTIKELLLKETVNLMRGRDPDFEFIPEFSEELKKGYETGNLSAVFERVSDYMERRNKTKLEIAKRMIEPTLFLIISMMIIFIVVFMYGPMIKEMIKMI